MVKNVYNLVWTEDGGFDKKGYPNIVDRGAGLDYYVPLNYCLVLVLLGRFLRFVLGTTSYFLLPGRVEYISEFLII